MEVPRQPGYHELDESKVSTEAEPAKCGRSIGLVEHAVLGKKASGSLDYQARQPGRRVGTSMGTDTIFQNAKRLNLVSKARARGRLNVG